jgi:ABC-type bacteriocin/lantibiotic exporter with double-glycine peptidase domain
MNRIFLSVIIALIILPIFSCAPTPVIVQKPANVPLRYIIDSVPQLHQGRKECGPTALAMVLRYWGVKKSSDELKDDLNWDPEKGVSFMSMLNFPYQKYGLRVNTIDSLKTGSIEAIMEQISQGRPVIALQYINYGGLTHWRVVIGYDHKKGKIYMRDPEITRGGLSVVNYKQFLNLWDLSTKNSMITPIPEKD